MHVDYFSLGEYCGTAFNIRRHTLQNEAYFFDWLVTRNSALEFITKENEDFFMPGNWSLRGEPGNEDIRVMDKHSGLLFQHEFPILESGRIDRALVDVHLAKAKDKFVYLKNKTVVAIRQSRRCVLIRSENNVVTLDDALRRHAEINQIFSIINPRVKIILCSSAVEGEWAHPDLLVLKMAETTEWVGDLASWDRLFAVAGNHFVFE
jgi:hypothetical protein